jgi:CTP synthase (UTP-ammonia lyase)
MSGPMKVARVAIVGDSARNKHSHWATEAALFHAGARLGIAVEPHWIATPSLASVDEAEQLAAYDGVWGAPGSPYASAAGMLSAITYAREHDLAYLGTCGGFQYALPRWEEAGMRVAARGADGEMRAFELHQNQFFIATLFQPQLSSSFDRPHPLIVGFLQASTAQA